MRQLLCALILLVVWFGPAAAQSFETSARAAIVIDASTGDVLLAKNADERYADAEACLLEATKVSQQQNSIGEYAAVLFEQLVLSKKRQQFDEALAFGYECLESFKKLGSLRWEALIKTQLGLLHHATSNSGQAAGLLEEGLQIFCELGDGYEQAYSYYYLSIAYAEISDLERSDGAKQQARQLNRELNDAHLAELLA